MRFNDADSGEKGREAGLSLGLGLGLGVGLHEEPGGAARGGPAGLIEVLDTEASLDALREIVVSCQCTWARWQRSSSIRDVASPRECSAREGSQCSSRSLSGNA